VNPRIGSDLQYGREVEEEKTVEVVRNHKGGTRVGIGVPTSKVCRAMRKRGAGHVREPRSRAETLSDEGTQRGANRRSEAETRKSGDVERSGSAEQPGVGLFDRVRWRGDLWTTPREETRLCRRVARIETRRESRRQGQEGRASHNESDGKRTDRGSSRIGKRKRIPRSRRAAVNGQGAATSIGVLPPQVVPVECGGVARTMPQRESAASTGVDRCSGSRSHSSAERGGR